MYRNITPLYTPKKTIYIDIYMILPIYSIPIIYTKKKSEVLTHSHFNPRIHLIPTRKIFRLPSLRWPQKLSIAILDFQIYSIQVSKKIYPNISRYLIFAILDFQQYSIWLVVYLPPEK